MKSIHCLIATTLSLFTLSCGPKSNTAEGLISIVRNEPRSTPAFYQFNQLVGSRPQTQFNPKYKPNSRSFHGSRTVESAGALLYTVQTDGIYVLIGKENQNGLWNFMRGSVDIGDHYVGTAAAEIHQETGGVYTITEPVLLSESYDVFYKSSSRNYACTFFVSVPYVPASSILSNSKKQSDHRFKEMSEYDWIDLNDLKSALSQKTPIFQAKTIDGKLNYYNFYAYSFSILEQAYNKRILCNLD